MTAHLVIQRRHGSLTWCSRVALTLCAGLSCLAQTARAEDLRAPPGLMLCGSMAGATSWTHAGCWLSPGGQKVERINAMPTISQLVIRSSNGRETAVVYTTREAADAMQRSGR